MTEHEWLASADPAEMGHFLTGRASDRQLLLFACAAYRLLWPPPARGVRRAALEAAERYADGLIGWDDLRPHHEAARRAAFNVKRPLRMPFWCAGSLAARWGPAPAEGVSFGCLRDLPDRAPAVSDILRDIVGNPFRPVAPDPSWLTSTVVGLAAAIYDARAFHDLPILADALQDCGCDDEAVLAHCRGAGPHARGCWVVDLCLGKS